MLSSKALGLPNNWFLKSVNSILVAAQPFAITDSDVFSILKVVYFNDEDTFVCHH